MNFLDLLIVHCFSAQIRVRCGAFIAQSSFSYLGLFDDIKLLNDYIE